MSNVENMPAGDKPKRQGVEWVRGIPKENLPGWREGCIAENEAWIEEKKTILSILEDLKGKSPAVRAWEVAERLRTAPALDYKKYTFNIPEIVRDHSDFKLYQGLLRAVEWMDNEIKLNQDAIAEIEERLRE
jgi:hypothetical protein